MENQESPQTDQDVIDWILDNLIEKSRTRRAVIKKLKELGLIFKAPTKKSNANAANKNLFIKDEDDKLRELYDEHRLDQNCFGIIMEVFNKKRSKKAVLKRMVQLGIIADESEIVPTRKKKNRHEHENFSESSDSDDDDVRPNKSRPMVKKFQMNQREIAVLRTELEEMLKEAIEWIIESLNEAADDFEEPSDDPDDAIPIVPFTESQKLAMENAQFLKLLESINLLGPQEIETYWKIPANMMPDELRQRSKILSGEEIVIDDDPIVNRNASDDDEDEGDDLFSRLRAQRDALVYNRSDNEDERAAPVKKVAKKLEAKVSKPNTKHIKQLLPDVVNKHSEAVKWIVSNLRDKADNKTSEAIDEMLLVPSNEKHKSALQDENFHKLLLAVNLIPPDGSESMWRVPLALNVRELMKRVELLEVKEDSSDDEEQQMVIKRKKKPVMQESEGFNINTQELKQRLAELDSSDEDIHNESMQKSKRNVLESSDDEVASASEKRKLGKRDRSELDDETPDENEMNATNSNQLKRIRRIADSSDDE